MFLRGWGWITVLVVPLILVTSTIALHNGYVAFRLAIEGDAAEAVVTAKRRVDADGDTRSGGRENHYLDFSFESEGRMVTDTSRVSEAFSHSVRRLETLPIRHVRDDPMINEIEPGAHASEARKALLWLGLTILIAGPILRRQWRRAKDMVWVRDNGEARTVRITSHKKTSMQVNDRTAFRLHWEDENGATGRTTMVNKFALERYPVGSEITVYFDPIKGKAPIWQVEVGPPRKQ